MTILQTTRLLAALRWSRLVNRMRFGFRKQNPQKRSGTPRKGGSVAWVVSLILAFLFVFQGAFNSVEFFTEVAFFIGPLRDSAGHIEVSHQTYEKLQAFAKREVEHNEGASEPEVFKWAENEWSGLKRRKEWAERMNQYYNEQGLPGFVSVENERGGYLRSVAAVWRHPEGRWILLKAAGAFLMALALARLCLDLGSSQDLGRVEWDVEWLFTLPVPPRHLFCSQILGHALVDPVSWLMILSFFLCSF